ncbi:hypothetical protein MKEN_00877100 [Mycena kentingensis (nom. inval.)]|nr:hypothetical protein MKEN_00877100 [Mycena kentingensis (nom. inval.)]
MTLADATAPPTSSTGFGRLDYDCFALIVCEVLATGGIENLANMSSASRVLRQRSMSFLFYACRISLPLQEHPPLTIRPHARILCYYHRTVYGVFHLRLSDAGLELFPCAHTIRFRAVRWVLWEDFIALLLPHFASISFDAKSRLEGVASDLTWDDSARVREFAYKVNNRRRVHAILSLGQIGDDLTRELANENGFLGAIVAGMNPVAELLDLPALTAPLKLMSNLRWPKLRHLALTSEFEEGFESATLQRLLSQMPALRQLSVIAARSRDDGRICLVDQADRSASFPDLISLEVAYPDPEDGIFDLPLTGLRRLALRDQPRFYTSLQTPRSRAVWSTPILSASECLHILQKQSCTLLEELQLVYDAEDDDDNELRAWLITAFPRLHHLELHRYRRRREEALDLPRILSFLVLMPSLHSVRLNLDMPGLPPANSDLDILSDWDKQFDRYSREISRILRNDGQSVLATLQILYGDCFSFFWRSFCLDSGTKILGQQETDI